MDKKMKKIGFWLPILFSLQLMATSDLMLGVQASKEGNQVKASGFFKKSCDSGDLKGCNILAGAYHRGSGVNKDDQKASQLYSKACNGGNADACFSLGVQYYNGNGVKKDQNKADQLYKKACDGGISEACTAVSFGR